MSSKRATRKKRREHFKDYQEDYYQPGPQKKEDKEDTGERAKLPGQMFLRVGAGLLMAQALLSALIVFYAVRQTSGMSPDDMIFFTAQNNQTPGGYYINLALTSILAVFEALFGYQIFRYARDPFKARSAMIYGTVMFALELVANIIDTAFSTTPFNVITLIYGCAIPLGIIYGAYKMNKFAKANPEYIPPEPTQMF